MKTIITSALIFSIIVCPVFAKNRSIAEHLEVASGIRLLEVWIESQMAYRGLPGIFIGIVYDQELIWAKGFGYTDREKKTPAAPGTIYRIASISKLFTSVAIMKLRDEGKLQLDDPIEKHLPWFAIKNTFTEAPVITIRHLLTLIPVSEHTFKIDGEGYGELGEPVVFELGTNGKVKRMKIGENYVYPQQ